MSSYTAKYVRREEVAEGTMAFVFEKPAGFAFKPGQAIELVLGSVPGASPEKMRHAFSLVSAPFENELVVATRMRDSTYKRALKVLTEGSPVQIEGPFGSMILHTDENRPAIFMAGGIGITPFMSMLRQAAMDQLPLHLTLLYSNRRPEDAAFLAELQQLELENKQFQMVATMTQMSRSSRPWRGETGYIDAKLLKKVVGDLSLPIYYVVGPPGLVESMRDTLISVGINEESIRSEEFYGY